MVRMFVMKKIVTGLFILMFIFSSSNLDAKELKLKFDIGGGLGPGWRVNEEIGDWDRSIYGEGVLDALIQIPMSKSYPIYLETGLSFGVKRAWNEMHLYDEYYLGQKYTPGLMRIPLNVGYELPLTEKNSLFFAFGPYIGWHFSLPEEGSFHSTQVGLSPSITFQHRKLTLGVSYITPCLYNGPKDKNRHTILFTVGCRFKIDTKWEGWSTVGQAVGALASTALEASATIAQQYAATKAGASSTSSTMYTSTDYSTSYDSSITNSTSRSDNVKEKTSGNNYHEQKAKEYDDEIKEYKRYIIQDRVYNDYHSQLSNYYAKHKKDLTDFDKRHWKDIQDTMRKLRLDFNSKSKKHKIQESKLESKSWSSLLDEL